MAGLDAKATSRSLESTRGRLLALCSRRAPRIVLGSIVPIWTCGFLPDGGMITRNVRASAEASAERDRSWCTRCRRAERVGDKGKRCNDDAEVRTGRTALVRMAPTIVSRASFIAVSVSHCCL